MTGTDRIAPGTNVVSAMGGVIPRFGAMLLSVNDSDCVCPM